MLAEWYSGNLYIQYGNEVYHEGLAYGTMCDFEKEITVSNGIVTKTTDYPTLTATNQSGFIRIWNGEEIDTRNVVPSLGELVRKNFKWSDEMTKNKDMKIIFYINDDCSNTIFTEAEYERNKTIEHLEHYKEIYSQTDNDEAKERMSKMVEYCKKELEKYETAIKEESENSGAYINELKRILTPAKVETLLYRGTPYLRFFEHAYSFDSETKTIKIDRRR